jgi:hypothetical protein
MKNVPVQAIFTGRVDGDGLYGEQWNLSGDRRVSIVVRDTHGRWMFSFIDLFPPYFIKF